jgi:hypothetical protein
MLCRCLFPWAVIVPRSQGAVCHERDTDHPRHRPRCDWRRRLIDAEGSLIAIEDLPTIADGATKWIDVSVLLPRLLELRSGCPARVIQQAMPGQSRSTAVVIGLAARCWRPCRLRAAVVSSTAGHSPRDPSQPCFARRSIQAGARQTSIPRPPVPPHQPERLLPVLEIAPRASVAFLYWAPRQR